ncbi:MAG TPA: MEDS domain-containing protein [Saprospiraceae bacterium]|nr:MEDS domain-containing protein [Saprospiraceae bacterium]
MLKNESSDLKNWRQCKTNVFWGEIAPADHLVQIYENDEVILDSLEGFVDSGIKAGDAVIVIATEEHLSALNDRLRHLHHDLPHLQSSHQYIPLNANDTLDKFMKDGWPDEQLFIQTVKDIINLARGKNSRRVRAYGEMVAILWGQGHNGATVHLESLWNKFCATEVFCLFCAYPKSGFTQDVNTSIEHICSTHSMMIAGAGKPKTEVHYHRTSRKIA